MMGPFAWFLVGEHGRLDEPAFGEAFRLSGSAGDERGSFLDAARQVLP
jgi:hypothetical protein